MTTIEICNSYQTSITVTAIFSFIAGMLLCERNLLSDCFFFCEGSPLFESKIKNRRCLKISFPTEHLFFYTVFLFQI